eukprot:4814328-Pleurochrysis_carterae.AAC.2
MLIRAMLWVPQLAPCSPCRRCCTLHAHSSIGNCSQLVCVEAQGPTAKRMINLRVAVQAAVRTREIDACESLVDLQTLSQRLAALVANLRVAVQAAMRTREINARESLVDLQALSQRLAALVADASAPCMQIA